MCCVRKSRWLTALPTSFARRAIRQARALLNYYLGRPLEFPTRLAGDFEEKPWEQQNLDELQKEALRRRPEIQHVRIAERSAMTQVDLAQAENRLRVDFTGIYGM